MGKLNDLKEKIYGDYIHWLKAQKFDDCFSNDIWANKIFDKLFQAYQDDRKLNGQLNMISVEEIEKILQTRKEKQSKIIQANKKIIK